MCNHTNYNLISIVLQSNKIIVFFNTLVNRLAIEKKKKKKNKTKQKNLKKKINSHSVIVQNLKLEVLIGHIFAINAQQGPIGVENEFLNLSYDNDFVCSPKIQLHAHVMVV
jgi:hypothetical protein